ncbi:MAG: cytochrome c [Deltaproteobacteria bacterium]|nr:cytochrome c [Deltaproteobacteria bacterium]
MRKILSIGVVALSIAAFAGTALAADGAAIYKAKCAACHGVEGVGTAMAPAHKGNEWVKKHSNDEVAAVIKNGREGAAKLYKNFVLAMPKAALADDEVKAVVDYLKTLAGK